jgi:hypothetical protein
LVVCLAANFENIYGYQENRMVKFVRNNNGSFKKKDRRVKLTKELVYKIIDLWFEGKSVRAIAKEIKVTNGKNVTQNISKTAVYNIVGGIPI